MSVKVRFAPFLRHFTGGQELVEVSGSTVGDCLEELEVQFPGIKWQLFEKPGELLEDLDIWVNGESAYPEGLAKQLKDGDEILILPILFVG